MSKFCAKHFTCIILFNIHGNTPKCVLFLASFNWLGNWGVQRLSNMPRVTQVGEPEGTQTSLLLTTIASACLYSPCFFPAAFGHTSCAIFSSYLTVLCVATLYPSEVVSSNRPVPCWEQKPALNQLGTEASIHLNVKALGGRALMNPITLTVTNSPHCQNVLYV